MRILQRDLREKLLEAQDHTCVLCGHLMTRADASFEHLTPRSLGGVSHGNNIALSHKRCNNRRGSAPLTEAQRLRLAILLR